MLPEISVLIKELDDLGYVIEEELATVLLLMMKLKKPLLLEGHPGVGKTEAAYIVAAYLKTEVIRLQCYEGLDINAAVYEWNYQKQLLSIKTKEGSEFTPEEKESHIFSEAYLLKRPLLKAITAKDKAPVLLIDEIDRADEEFEAFLLELLSDFQMSIPELGTIKATHKPIVLLTSNRTRELSDALKRRCLYHWVSYPTFQQELEIVNKHYPDINSNISEALVHFVRYLRTIKLNKTPGIAETLDWVSGLLALEYETFDPESLSKTLGCVLKSEEDMATIKSMDLNELIRESQL